MNIFESLIYGLVSGFSEFLPVSSRGHQAILRLLFGISDPEPLREILVRIAILLAIFVSCGTYIEKLRRVHKTGVRSRRMRHIDSSAAYDLRIIRSAGIPMVISMLIAGFFGAFSNNLALVALFFLINGVAVYIPEHLPHGNKDASRMSALDGTLIGVCGALSVFPGISRVGCGLSCGIVRGADRQKSFDWILVLSIPAVLIWIFFDIVNIFTAGIGYFSFGIFAGCLLSAVSAFVSACCSIFIMRFILQRSDVSGFGYYCWGMAMLSFILYLTA